MRRFFVNDITDTAVVTNEEARHMCKVLRLKKGDEVVLFNGSGYDYISVIKNISDKQVELEVKQKTENTKKLPFSLTLYQSFIKKDNMDFVLQKATELGIDRFVCFNSSRTVKIPGNKDKVLERYNKIAVEAAKQCGRATVPIVEFAENSKDVSQRIGNHDIFLFAYEKESVNIKKCLAQKDFNDIAVVIGPEGGFEEDEARMFIEGGAVSCSLGNLILRAETAGIAACSMIIYDKMEK